MRRLRIILLSVVLVAPLTATLWPAPAAHAVPLFFEGPGGYGFAAEDLGGMVIALTVDGGYSWDSAGAPEFSPSLEVTTSLVDLIGAEPMPPSFADPLLAIVEYTVTNTTGAPLDDELLVFTLGAVDGDPDPWPAIEPHEFGLDSAGFVLIEAAPFYFAAVFLPVMAPGEVHSFQLVHVVADELGGTVIPSPGLALLRHPAVPDPGPEGVPEPCASVLLGLGLLATRLRRRR